MAKPRIHALSSAKKFGGQPDDYGKIHQFMDSSKSAHAGLVHRALFHHEGATAIVEKVFGVELHVTVHTKVPVASVVEQHIVEDLGYVPNLSAYLKEFHAERWAASRLSDPTRPPDRHAEVNAKKWGGVPADYIRIHEFMDQFETEPLTVDFRRRSRIVLHHAFGCFVAEWAIGETITNLDGRVVSVRDIAETHIIREFGHIPDLGDWARLVDVKPWMSGTRVLAPKNVD